MFDCWLIQNCVIGAVTPYYFYTGGKKVNPAMERDQRKALWQKKGTWLQRLPEESLLINTWWSGDDPYQIQRTKSKHSGLRLLPESLSEAFDELQVRTQQAGAEK
jgi:hypothetical protein